MLFAAVCVLFAEQLVLSSVVSFMVQELQLQPSYLLTVSCCLAAECRPQACVLHLCRLKVSHHPNHWLIFEWRHLTALNLHSSDAWLQMFSSCRRF
jgi:hypothetical protein